MSKRNMEQATDFATNVTIVQRRKVFLANITTAIMTTILGNVFKYKEEQSSDKK